MSSKQKLSNLEANRITRDALKNSLVTLMNEKDFKSITISELTKLSGVSRCAFYRNYNSKEDILLEISKDTIQEIYQVLSKSKNKNSFMWYKKCFEQIKKYYKIAKLLIVDASIPIQELYRNIIKKKENTNSKDEYKELSYESALSSIIFRWLNTDMKESEEEMASLCTELFEKVSL